MTIYILGGGPTAMAIADGLTDSSEKEFILIEANSSLGGLAQTITWADVGLHDLGPHKIFTLDQDLMSRVHSLLSPDQWIDREKTSRVYMGGKFLPYPPSPFSLAKVFGYGMFLKMVYGYFLAKVKGIFVRKKPTTFEEDLQSRLGNSLYAVLFRPIALKLWGNPAKLDQKLSKGRIQTPSLLEVLSKSLGMKKKNGFEALTFSYPRGGLQKLWDAIKLKSENTKRGQFITNNKVIEINTQGKKIQTIKCQDNKGTTTIYEVKDKDFVVSTMPLTTTISMIKNILKSDVVEKCNEVIALNDLILVFLHIDKESLFPESWIFVPDPEIVFHRVSEQESFDPGMTSKGSIVCCEIMSNEGRVMNQKNNSDLIDLSIRGLRMMGYHDFKVLKQKVIRLPQSYPVFYRGYFSALSNILNELDSLENFKSIGRQGAFNYIGTMDAMDIGYGFARWLSDSSASAWSDERERTSHYPVLD